MAFAICGIVFLLVGCTRQANSNPLDSSQIATVQKGSISINVTGTGNLALENKQKLSFGQTGLVTNAQTVKISDVLVNEGDMVDQGQILVKSDTTDWQNQITADQHAQDAARAGLVQAQASVGQAQSSVNQAKANLQTAQYALSMQTDIKAILDGQG